VAVECGLEGDSDEFVGEAVLLVLGADFGLGLELVEDIERGSLVPE
jgi:hypothetical protein